MALGSSAPEILLSVIETVTMLGLVPGELGPSTIVGSAAFNLLVISGVSIIAVGDTPKKIDDMGVFTVTCLSSLFAYVWMYIVLKIWTPEYVTMIEAFLTLSFFVLLISFAYVADRINDRKKTREASEEEKQRDKIKMQISTSKGVLREIAEKNGAQYVISAITSPQTIADEGDRKTIERHFKTALETDDLSVFHYEDLFHALQPETVLERINYRKNVGNAIGGRRQFLVMRGVVGQAEHLTENMHQLNLHPQIGFKCLHYSVTESSGNVEITIKKKGMEDMEFGVRTIDDTAKSPNDYKARDDVIRMKANESE